MSAPTKRVVAEFNVPANMWKEDVALLIDCLEALTDADATVWNNRADYEADVREGLV